MKNIERIDDFINYGKLAIVVLIILFGADPTPRGLLILSLAVLLVAQIEGLLLLYKQYLLAKRRDYINNLIDTIIQVKKENEGNNKVA